MLFFLLIHTQLKCYLLFFIVFCLLFVVFHYHFSVCIFDRCLVAIIEHLMPREYYNKSLTDAQVDQVSLLS